MIEKVVLGVILLAALMFIARLVMRAIASGTDGSKPPSCAGCPFDSKCQMQDREHLSEFGGDTNE